MKQLSSNEIRIIADELNYLVDGKINNIFQKEKKDLWLEFHVPNKGKTYLHRERAFSVFRRRIGLGENIDINKVSANMADGILEVKLPKLEPEPEKKRRKITPL